MQSHHLNMFVYIMLCAALQDGEIAQDDSIHEIEIRRLNTTNRNGGAKLVSNNRNKQHLNPTAINR